VFPVVFLALFGIIESGIFFATSSTTNNAARDGARYGASNFANASSRQTAADQIRNEVVDSLGGLTSYGEPLSLWVYEADPTTGNPRTNPTTCTDKCFRYVWDGTNFVFQGGAWGSTSGTVNEVDACVGGSTTENRAYGGVDSLGVEVKVRYRSVSGIISDRVISHRTTLRIEPMPTAQCSSGI
jgi:Flp pilus assembly protein TadG